MSRFRGLRTLASLPLAKRIRQAYPDTLVRDSLTFDARQEETRVANSHCFSVVLLVLREEPG